MATTGITGEIYEIRRQLAAIQDEIRERDIWSHGLLGVYMEQAESRALIGWTDGAWESLREAQANLRSLIGDE